MKYVRSLICFFVLLLIPSMCYAQKTTSTHITDFGPQNVWDLRDERGELLWRKIHENCGPGGFGAWRSSSAKLGIREKRAQASFVNCIASNMRKAGASPQAVAFTRQMKGEVYMGSFREMGKVDIVTIVAPLWNDPNVEDLILVNGTPRIINPWDKVRNLDITRDRRYPSLKRRFPNITMWPMHGFVSMQQSPQGGQRFILRFTLLNGCHACDMAGFANIAFDFDTTGRFSGTKLLYLTEDSGRTEPQTTSNPAIPFTIIDEFHGSTLGNAYGITYTKTPYGEGAEFSRRNESRVQYMFSQGFPKEGTLEFWIKVDSGYRYSNYELLQNQDEALIFTTDIAGGDVTWPGSSWLWVKSNGDVSFNIATEKYQPPIVLRAERTNFRFGAWHSIGISFGGKGQHIMVDGNLAASNLNPQSLGSGGNHDNPVDLPTIGESVSGFWNNNQHEGGFEGILAKFRTSMKQNDWLLSAAEPSQSENTRDVNTNSNTPSQIALAGFQSPDGKQFVLAPFLLYTSNQYVPLPQGINATPEDNAKTYEAKKASIFNRVRNFDVYRKGKKIGSFSVTEIKATYIGAITKIVGIGQANGFEPNYGDIAISSAYRQEGFWPASPLDITQRKQLRALALGLLPKTIPRNNVLPETGGKRIILDSIREQTTVLDLDRDGNPEVAFQISASIKSPKGGLNAFAFVLAHYDGTAQRMSKLLSSAVITQGELIYGKASYDFFNSVDVDGDGVAEVILSKGYGEVGSLEVFSLHDGRLHKVCVIPSWSGS